MVWVHIGAAPKDEEAAMLGHINSDAIPGR